MGRDITQRAVVPKQFGQVVHRKFGNSHGTPRCFDETLEDKGAVGSSGLAASRKRKLK